MRPKEVEPDVADVTKNREYWKKRTLSYLGDDIYFDQEIRTGVCYLCKKDGRTQKSERTALHHLKYDHDDKLAWTIEVCNSCHWQIDEHNRESIAKSTGRKIPYRYGKFYLNKQQKKEKEEQDKRDWWMRYCMNLSSGWEPYPKSIPTRELYDKVVEAIKKHNTDSRRKIMGLKKESMSDVSKRYS